VKRVIATVVVTTHKEIAVMVPDDFDSKSEKEKIEIIEAESGIPFGADVTPLPIDDSDEYITLVSDVDGTELLTY
jgi:hypothetical protein